jgi:hypothetical protein
MARSIANRCRLRRRIEPLPGTVEVLEARTLLANGITVTPGPLITVALGTKINNADFATYTVTDPSGEPGTQWRALINFGDGQIDGPVIPIENGATFEFVDSHRYRAPGVYTVTVMIAVPESHLPNGNTVTTQVTVTASGPTPTPTPTPPPQTPILSGKGLSLRAREHKTFHGSVARFNEPQTTARQFQALIDWGDGSALVPGLIRAQARGRFVVVGSHRYVTPGVYHVVVRIQNQSGQEILTQSAMRVVK